MSEELKYCPYCGSNHVDPEGWMNESGKTGPECCVCGATAASIADWNTRHIPAGFALVPIEPTEEMLIAGGHNEPFLDDIYKSMIKAAGNL